MSYLSWNVGREADNGPVLVDNEIVYQDRPTRAHVIVHNGDYLVST